MDLHIDYETIVPHDLRVVYTSNIRDKDYKFKGNLKVNKTKGILEIDSTRICWKLLKVLGYTNSVIGRTLNGFKSI